MKKDCFLFGSVIFNSLLCTHQTDKHIKTVDIMAKFYNLKVANMRKKQTFILYPYNGGETVLLQSDKRMIQASLKTGKGLINRTNRDYANVASIMQNPMSVYLPNDILADIQRHLWENDGKDGYINGVISYENKELFSK